MGTKTRPYKQRRVGNRLPILRIARRWSQAEVARRMGYQTKMRYWQIENEMRLPTFKERAKLARIFGVRESEIFPLLVRAA